MFDVRCLFVLFKCCCCRVSLVGDCFLTCYWLFVVGCVLLLVDVGYGLCLLVVVCRVLCVVCLFAVCCVVLVFVRCVLFVACCV